MLTAEPHALLDARAFTSTFPAALSDVEVPSWLLELLKTDAEAPLRSDDTVRAAVRDLLRHGGYKPTGRGKPASEYLIRAVSEESLGSINAAVDACNVVSLHSGLPISVIDLDRGRPPFRIAVAKDGDSYIFNASGQAIDLAGLICLFDTEGPCANAVKDAQRTKTDGKTRRTLSVVWGSQKLAGRSSQAVSWYRELVTRLGAATEMIPISPA